MLFIIAGPTMSEKQHCNVSKFFRWTHKTKYENANTTALFVNLLLGNTGLNMPGGS
jgi:hypothetical protein